jgi:peptidoglycan hydrolase CwlO-like protein
MRIICEYLKYILLFSLILCLVLPNFSAISQADCETREECEALLKKYEEDIEKLEGVIGKTEQEKKTLQNQIYILKKKIEKLSLQIQESNVMIRDVGLQIKDTESSIEKTSLKIEESQIQLANILRTIYEQDQRSLIEILLSEAELSDFFDNLMALETLNSKNQELLETIKNLKSSLETQKQSLDEEKADLERLLKIQLLQKGESEKTKKDQEYFLKLTEAQYQKYLKEKEETEKKAAAIRARIFELIGVPKAPTFGEALEIAKYVERITGVRPAFLLAVLTQESNIGKNVGQCYLKDLITGDGVTSDGKTVAKVMKPSRDVEPFLQITKELGRDPYNTPVSCPIPSLGGYGGAMGPAQFIPSTWMKYLERVKEITGKAADPWDIKDAFLAAALYLADYGATKQTSDAEWKAAMIYFSGTINTKYRFYGDSVLSIATKYEEDIKTLEAGLTFGEPKLPNLSFQPLFPRYCASFF